MVVPVSESLSADISTSSCSLHHASCSARKCRADTLSAGVACALNFIRNADKTEKQSNLNGNSFFASLVRLVLMRLRNEATVFPAWLLPVSCLPETPCFEAFDRTGRFALRTAISKVFSLLCFVLAAPLRDARPVLSCTASSTLSARYPSRAFNLLLLALLLKVSWRRSDVSVSVCFSSDVQNARSSLVVPDD